MRDQNQLFSVRHYLWCQSSLYFQASDLYELRLGLVSALVLESFATSAASRGPQAIKSLFMRCSGTYLCLLGTRALRNGSLILRRCRLVSPILGVGIL